PAPGTPTGLQALGLCQRLLTVFVQLKLTARTSGPPQNSASPSVKVPAARFLVRLHNVEVILCTRLAVFIDPTSEDRCFALACRRLFCGLIPKQFLDQNAVSFRHLSERFLQRLAYCGEEVGLVGNAFHYVVGERATVAERIVPLLTIAGAGAGKCPPANKCVQ